MTEAAAPEQRRLVVDYEKFVSAAMVLFMSFVNVGMIEPSPYDLTSLIAMPIWFIGGFKVHRSFILFAGILLIYLISGFIALTPYLNDPSSTIYFYQTVYLVLTGLFFALYSGEKTQQRVELLLVTFCFSSLIAAGAGALGYFDIAGLGAYFSYAGRASGTLKDPNVMGSAVILAILYLTLNLMLGRARSTLLTATGLMIVFSGMFLTFSRGSYASTAVSFAVMMISVFVMSEDPRMKRRILLSAAGALMIVAAVVAVILSLPETREFFSQRTAATQDYDEGPTGRFGNQLRSIPMLLDRFWGFGPLRFRLVFDLDPHNSYVGSFANYGWIGGVLFILLVAVTTFIGLRLLFSKTPYLRQAQAIVPTTLSLFMQGFQIDVDHWRHAFFLIGVVWGLETARQRWLERSASLPLNAAVAQRGGS
ncbi:MAG: O-antigen ligase family protein [Methylocystis sp.]